MVFTGTLLPEKTIHWSCCVCTKPTNELVQKFTKTQEIKHSPSGHAPPPIKRLLYLHMQSGWGCGSSKEFLLFADVFSKLWGYVFLSGLKTVVLEPQMRTLASGWIIQKWLKRKIALLSKNGLRFCAMRLSIQRQM